MSSNLKDKDKIEYKYNFIFEDEKQKSFLINVNRQSLDLIQDNNINHKEWAKLKNFKCPHCPLSEDEVEYCPLAVSLSSVIESFSDSFSYERITLSIVTEERDFKKETSLQDGVRSMLGLIMVTSGCPIMGKLKPMARFHLPLSSLEETQFRYLSTYIFAQFFVAKHGGVPDWEMTNLNELLENIKLLNMNVSKKIAELETNDTTINSVVILNNFTDYIGINLDENTLNEVEVLFKDYFNDIF